VLVRRQGHERTRWETARGQGIGLYLTANKGAQAVHQSLIELYRQFDHAAKGDPQLSRYRNIDLLARHSELLRELRPPAPDARFWNAMLAIYGRWDGMSARRKWRRARSFWIARMKSRKKRGVLTKEMAVLREIAKDMESVGIQLPLGFQRALDGLSNGTMTRKDVEVRPYGLPSRSGTFNPFKIPTFKTRGLPVRRSGVSSWRRKETQSTPAASVGTDVVVVENGITAS